MLHSTPVRVNERGRYLERNEPDALDGIADQQQVFEHTQACDIDADV